MVTKQKDEEKEAQNDQQSKLTNHNKQIEFKERTK